MRRVLTAAALTAALAMSAAAPLRLSLPFGDGMVLQRRTPIKVEGIAAPGRTVTVGLAGDTVSAASAADGSWLVTLPAREADKGLSMTVTDGHDTIGLTDIAVGEVWIASGQSNMEFRLRYDSWRDSAMVEDADLRFFTMRPIAYTNPPEWSAEVRAEVDSLRLFAPAEWESATRKTLPDQSAIAYYFARELRDSLAVPVGVITNAIGGSPIESWMSRQALASSFPAMLDNWPDNDAVQPWVRQRMLQNVPDAADGHGHPYAVTYLYDSAVRPLGQFAVAGVIWYQGESNAHDPAGHELMFPAMVQCWRETAGQPDMPFHTVQLSSIARDLWPEFRDSQRRMAAAMPHVTVSVSSDSGDSLDVHPRVKRPVGHRLALQALAMNYGRPLDPSGPMPVGAAGVCGGDSVRLLLSSAHGLTTSDGTDPRTFELMDGSGQWHPATARILPDGSVLLYAQGVTDARSVRYGWQPFTRANLINDKQLPASTFMIDILSATDPDAGITAGVSAPFAGRIGGMVVSAGGANFPEDPLGAASQKKLYRGIYATSADKLTDGLTPQWHRIGLLPDGIAYGASACNGDTLYMIGGTDNSGAVRNVTAMWLDGDMQPQFVSMPPLPVAMDNMGAAVSDNVLYVSGGNADGKPCNMLLALDLSKPEKWKKLKSFPGNPRTQPAMAAADGALWLFGGFAGGKKPTLDRDILRYDIAKGKWSCLTPSLLEEDADINFGGGVAAAMPDGSIVVAGGVNPEVFLNALRAPQPDYIHHPVEWYRFNSAVCRFDPRTGELTLLDRTSDAARAGASLVPVNGDTLVLLGGELKPRIRTPRHHIIRL